MSVENSDNRRMSMGGYFGLELPHGTGEYHRNVLRYQSARAAFLALLRAGRPAAVWMPWYVCSSLIEPLTREGIPVRRYQLDAQLRVVDAVPGVNEWLLYVNYFGICRNAALDALRRFDPRTIVIDNSQAFYSPREDCLATIYSPRKFFGVPDGGYMATDMNIQEPEVVDAGSVARCAHLLQRLGGETESGYADFVLAEAVFCGQEPRRMSVFTRNMLSHIQYPQVAARRRQNFLWLHERIGATNSFKFVLRDDEVPLCYPYLTDRCVDRKLLVESRIYCPCYWPEVAGSTLVPEFEAAFSKKTLFIPCDQRMTDFDMEQMLSILEMKGFVERLASKEKTERRGLA